YNENGVFNPILRHNNACKPLFSLIYDGLFAVGTDGVPEPRLAQSITYSEGCATIRLREDAFFHDGTSVRAADVVWSLKMARENENSVYAARLSNVTEITSSDNLTVVLSLERSHGSLEYCLDIPIIKNGTGVTSNAMGTGRYRVIAQEESMYLMANEEWYALPEDSDFPTDLIILTYVDNLDDLVYSMVSGNSNLVALDPFIFDDRKISGNCDVYPVETRDFLYIAFNTSYYAHTSRSDVRKALAEAINVSEILATAYNGVVYSQGIYPESVTGVAPGEPPAGDPVEAGRQLRAAGYKFIGGMWQSDDGETMELTIVCGHESAKRAAAEIIAENLAAVGIKTEIVFTDDMSATLYSGRFDIAVCETSLSPDYDFRYLLSYDGAENYNDFAITGLDEQLSNFFSAGHANSSILARNISETVLESMPIVPIGYKQELVCVSREFSFGNVQVTAGDYFANIFQWVRYR
ncbi:MAG: ABC transporter substrate-binding protein, partial [Clostridia bacterium]|nr:ABC transporter substrate-binding protein [Clostridia bacterium]